MHKFIRTIGFSDITKKEFDEILRDIINKPEKIKVTKDSEGNEFAELSFEVAKDNALALSKSNSCFLERTTEAFLVNKASLEIW